MPGKYERETSRLQRQLGRSLTASERWFLRLAMSYEGYYSSTRNSRPAEKILSITTNSGLANS